MKHHILGLVFVSLAAASSACTVNMGTNSANAPAANTTANNAAPASAAANYTNTAKSPEPAKPAAKGSDDPKSESEQIQFTKGETDTTLERTIAPGVSKTYLFGAKKGQHVWFRVTEPTGQLEAAFNKNDVALGEEVKEMLTSSGDWAIYVNNNTDKTLKYKLWIGIE